MEIERSKSPNLISAVFPQHQDISIGKGKTLSTIVFARDSINLNAT